MHLTIDAEQTAELRHAINDRVDSLKKLRKKLDDSGLSTDEVDDRLRLLRGGDGVTGLTQLLDDQTDAFEARRQREREEGQTTIEEALEGVEDEAERRKAAQLLADKRHALAVALGLEDGAVPPIDADEMTDADIVAWLIDAWEDTEYEDPDSDELKSWPGILRVELAPAEDSPEDAPGRVVWCAVNTDDDEPRFFFGVEPELFDPAVVAPDFANAHLFREVRRAWGVLPEEAGSETPAAEQPDTEASEAEFEAWKQRTRPQAQMDDATGIVLQGAHTLIFAHDGLSGLLSHAREVGISDEDLERSLRDGINQVTQCSEAINIVGDGNIEYVAVEWKNGAFTSKRGRRRETLKGQELVHAIRTMLELPEPGEAAEHEAQEEETAAVGADSDDLPF